MTSTVKTCVLDTNVLMHDPTALFRFEEHNVCVPLAVLEELDERKNGNGEVARNTRQALRFLNDLMVGVEPGKIEEGVPIAPAVPNGNGTHPTATGRLFFYLKPVPKLPGQLSSGLPDNKILGTALALTRARPERRITLVTKDTSLRIKAAVLGIHAEDYANDRVVDDLAVLYSGTEVLPETFWTQYKIIGSWKEADRTYYRVHGPNVARWYPGQCLCTEEGSSRTFEGTVLKVDGDEALLRSARNFRTERHAVSGVVARNREQNFALNMLLDPEVDFVTLAGTAGSGKTLMALAAALSQVERNQYKGIIVSRENIPVGEDIGFLPGTEEEKMTPWMGALVDNLEVLGKIKDGERKKDLAEVLNALFIRIRSFNFMRGRTIQERFFICDEAQNLTLKQMKTLITRVGPGTKLVCLGNIEQIDTPYLTETTSGLTYVVNRFKQWPHSGHITLKRGERSRLATFASGVL